ncbi:MAG: CTP synthetase [Pseudomonadota bacterium]
MWLIAFLHIFIGSTLAGALVIAVLVMGSTTWLPMLIAALAGYVAAAPVSWVVARKIREFS